MEQEKQVKVIRVQYKCDDCQTGNLIATGHGITKWHTEWEHKCDVCGQVRQVENIQYPYIKYEEI